MKTETKNVSFDSRATLKYVQLTQKLLSGEKKIPIQKKVQIPGSIEEIMFESSDANVRDAVELWSCPVTSWLEIIYWSTMEVLIGIYQCW